MPEGHSPAGPSGASRWMVCPASVTVPPPVPPAASFYAKEGSAAHWAAERLLAGECFLPRRIAIDGEEFSITAEMMGYLEPYLVFVEKLMVERPHYAVETRIEVSGTGGLVWGTADFFAWSDKLLDVVDFKFGMGVPVGPTSPQLFIYALGALETALKFGHQPDIIRTTVIQPRLDPTPKSYIQTRGDLTHWANEEFYPAVDRLLTGDTAEVAGDHCRFCARRAQCETYARKHAAGAKKVFDPVEI